MREPPDWSEPWSRWHEVIVNSKTPETHLHSDGTAGVLQLPPAVRPAQPSLAPLVEGYRLVRYADEAGRPRRLLTAAVSADRLLDVYLGLLEVAGDELRVVLETSHDDAAGGHTDLSRSEIDRPVLASHLCEFEELLLNDGCVGVAAIDEGGPTEVQLDEHKLIHVFARDLKPFRKVLHRHGVTRVRHLEVISDEEHLHYSDPARRGEFQRLACRLGVGDFDCVPSDENF